MKLPEKNGPKENLTIRVAPQIRAKYLKLSETKLVSKALSAYVEEMIEKLYKDNLAAS